MKQFIRELSRREVVFVGIIVVLVSLSGIYAYLTGREKLTQINSFEECAAAGNPIMDSFPEQCSANGKTFARRLSLQEKKLVNPDTVQWSTYQGEGFGISYPLDWQLKKPEKAGDSVVNIVSSDFTEIGQAIPQTSTGFWLEIYVYETISKGEDFLVPALYASYDQHLSLIKSRQDECGGSYNEIIVDEKQSIKSDINCQGDYVEAYVYHLDKEYIFRLNHSTENQNQAMEIFDDLTSTIVIE